MRFLLDLVLAPILEAVLEPLVRRLQRPPRISRFAAGALYLAVLPAMGGGWRLIERGASDAARTGGVALFVAVPLLAIAVFFRDPGEGTPRRLPGR